MVNKATGCRTVFALLPCMVARIALRLRTPLPKHPTQVGSTSGSPTSTMLAAWHFEGMQSPLPVYDLSSRPQLPNNQVDLLVLAHDDQ